MAAELIRATPEHAEAVGLRHLQIEEHDVCVVRLEPLERLISVRSDGDVVTEGSKAIPHDLPDRGIVVDHEETRATLSLTALRGHRALPSTSNDTARAASFRILVTTQKYRAARVSAQQDLRIALAPTISDRT